MKPLPYTLLFCPGDRPDRYAKAWSSGAPAVVLDLEDSVPLPGKSAARAPALGWLASDAARQGDVLPALRINPLRSAAGLDDLFALLHTAGLPQHGCLLLPKLDDAGELGWLESHLMRHLPGWSICGLVESARGLRQLDAIVRGSQRLAGLGFGAADLRAELGTGPAWDNLAAARTMLVLAAAGTAVRLLDVPCLRVDDEATLLDECARAKAIGFHGKFIIHPRQLAGVQGAFAPTADETEQARRIVAAYESHAGQACQVDGLMVDEPVYRQALRLLATGT